MAEEPQLSRGQGGLPVFFLVCCLVTAASVQIADRGTTKWNVSELTTASSSASGASASSPLPDTPSLPGHEQSSSVTSAYNGWYPLAIDDINTRSGVLLGYKSASSLSELAETATRQPDLPTSTVITTRNGSPTVSHRSPPTKAPCYAPGSSDIELHIVGLFAYNGSYPVGRAFRFAAELAIDDISARSDVLPGYKLVLEPTNTQCNIATGMDMLYRKLYNENCSMIMVLGGTCSDVTEQTALASFMYNLLQLSYSAVSPRLSNVEEFPWFFRMMAPESKLSEVRMELLRKFGWNVITMLQAPEHLFTSTGEDMRNKLQINNITLNDTLPFSSDPEKAIDQLKKNDARIIYFAAYEDQARNACCSAYHQGFYGPGIVWIFTGFFDLKWYEKNDTNCTREQILKVIDGYFTVTNVNIDEDEDGGETVGANTTEFLRRYKEKVRQEHMLDAQDPHAISHERYKDCHNLTEEDEDTDCQFEAGDSRAPLGYDAMWTIALALNATLTDLIANGSKPDALKEFSYDNREMGELIFRKMIHTLFRGVSGNVSFTSTGDRLPQIAIKQFQVNQTTGEVDVVTVGLYTNSNMTWCDECVRWKGGAQPLASRRTEHVLKPLSWQLYFATCFLAATGVLLSLAFLVFNVKNRNVKLIKMSSPKINNLILMGCILVYSTVTMDDISGHKMTFMCQIRLYLLVLGFSLGYGALFAKTWRVYEIMTASRKLSKVTKDLRDSRLFLTVALLVAVNVGLLVVWSGVDPMTMTAVDVANSEVQRTDDVTEISQTLVCQSQYKVQFTLGLLSLQALLILFGAFLSFQTRKITIPELNDSRWISLCIYNVVVLGSLGVILVLGTRQSPDVTYLLESVIIIVGTTLTQCLVFFPKLLAYRRFKRGRTGSQQNILTFRSMCVSKFTSSSSSSSIHSSNVKASADDAYSPPSSPSKAVRNASHAVKVMVKRCCSGEEEADGRKTCQHSDLVVDVQIADDTAPGKMSRAVSTCNIIASHGDLRSSFSHSRPESLYHGECRCMNAHLSSTDPFARDSLFLLDADRRRASCYAGRIGPKDCFLSMADQRHCCFCVARLSQSRWKQPMRRCLSSEMLDCNASRLPKDCHGSAAHCALCQPDFGCTRGFSPSSVFPERSHGTTRIFSPAQSFPLDHGNELRNHMPSCELFRQSSPGSVHDCRLSSDSLFHHDGSVTSSMRSCQDLVTAEAQFLKPTSAAEDDLTDDAAVSFVSGPTGLYRSTSVIQLKDNNGLSVPTSMLKRRLSVDEVGQSRIYPLPGLRHPAASDGRHAPVSPRVHLQAPNDAFMRDPSMILAHGNVFWIPERFDSTG